jgi:hypothetical protein
MGFLSRKKPKPAPVDIHEERPMEDELQGMEEAVPERYVDEAPKDDAPRDAGPVSDSGLSLPGESSESSPPAGRDVEGRPPREVVIDPFQRFNQRADALAARLKKLERVPV